MQERGLRLRVRDSDSGEIYNVFLLNTNILLDEKQALKIRAFDYDGQPLIELVGVEYFDTFDSERLSVIRCTKSASGVCGFEIHGITHEVKIPTDTPFEEVERILSKALISLCKIELSIY